MPIYKNNGVTYNIPDDKAAGFEAKFPGAMVALENEGVKYELPVSKKKGFLEKFPGATYSVAAPPAPKAEDINPTGDKSGYTFTAEELGMPDNTYKAESTSVAKLPEIKPLGVSRVSMGAEEDANVQPLTTFGEGVTQGAESMYEGGRYAAGEIGRIYGDSQRAYADALEYLDKQGDNFDASSFDKVQAMEDERNERFQLAMEDYRKEMAKRRKERENLGFFATIAHKWNDPERPDSRDYIASHYDDMRAGKAIVAVDEALKEANGDVEKAREILENKAKAESWGDRVTREAGEVLSQMKPVEGAAWWGQMVPQVTGQAAAIGANFIPGVGQPLSRALAIASTTALTASSAGSAMQEARAAGATDGEIMSAGALQAGIEYFSEKIPLERLLGKTGSAAFRKGFKGETGNIVGEEVERLLEEGNKRLGGKLLSGQTAKEFVKNVGVEAASEFIAEGAGTFVPMIYEDKENYPTLGEALENAIEGAKAGAVMGGFLGGGTQVLTNRANNARRKKQGNVMLAETKDGVVEVLQTNDGNAEVLNADGEVSWIPASELVKRYTYTYNEWENNEVDTRINHAYQEGYEAADEQKGAVKQAYDMERERVLNTFGEEVVQRLDDDPIGALMDMNEVDRQEAIAYVNARTAYEGMIDRISDDIDERIKASDKEIDSHKNRQDGAIHPAMMRGVNGAAPKRVYIVNGNVATFEDGTIDKANSSSMIIVRDAETGEVSAASADDLESLDAVIDTEAEKRTVAEQIANEYAGQQAVIIETESVNGEGENGVAPVAVPGDEAQPTMELTPAQKREEVLKRIPTKGKERLWTEAEPADVAEYIRLLTADPAKQQAAADKFIADIKAKQAKVDAISALEMDEQIAYWESVKALLQTESGEVKTENEVAPVVEETQAPVVESAPVADNTPQSQSDSSPTLVEQPTPQATNEMQPVSEEVAPTAEEIADAQAFMDAYALNTVEAFQNYLDNHPEGAYREGARRGMSVLEGTSSVPDIAPLVNAENVLQRAQAAQEADLENAEKGEKGQKAVEPVEENKPKVRGRKQVEKAVEKMRKADAEGNALEVLNNIQTAELNAKRGDEGAITPEELAEIDALKKKYAEQGYEMEDMTGKVYDEGMHLEAEFVIDESLPDGAEVIKSTLKPYIFKDGVLVQEAKVIVALSPVKAIKPVGKGYFGEIYDQFKNGFKAAFDFLVGKKRGEAVGVFNREGIGEIDLVWGDEKAGLSHILTKHVGEGKSFESLEDAKNGIADVVENGKVVFQDGDKVVIQKDGKIVTLRKNVREKGKKIADKNWILTAYDETKADDTSAISGTNKGQAAQPTVVSEGEGTTQSANEQENSVKSEIEERINSNFAAIETVKQLLERGEEPNEAQREIVSKFNGWAGLEERYDEIAQRLKNILSDANEHTVEVLANEHAFDGLESAVQRLADSGVEAPKAVDDAPADVADEVAAFDKQAEIAKEREQRAGVPPRPGHLAVAIGEGNEKAVEEWKAKFDSYLQKLNADDLPTIDVTIKGMQGRKKDIRKMKKDGYKDDSIYKAYDYIETVLKKRAAELKKVSATEQPKQENKPVESEPIKDEVPVTSETTKQPETGEVAVAGPVNRETLQLNMSEEDFNALLNSGDKVAISEYLAEMDGLLRIGAGSPLDGRDTIVKEYRGVVEQYGGEENIPADVVAGFDERIASYNALQRTVFDRKYALQDKLREIETNEAQAKEQAEKEAKAEHKQTAFGGFLAGKSDVGASTAEKALGKRYKFDDGVHTVAEYIEQQLENGTLKIETREEPKYKGVSRQAWNRMDARQQAAEEKRVKEGGMKTVYSVNNMDLGKTAYDYAKFLLEKKAEQEKSSQGKRSKGKTESESKPEVEKIEDVGEVLAGARKDALKVLASSFENATVKSLIELPFSKAFKKPDLKKAVESGALREEDALFYEAMFNALINSSKPKNSARHRNAVETWAEETYNSLQLIKSFVEADEAARDHAMAEALEDKFPARAEELAVIEKRKVWNARNNAEWGDKTTPNPVWVAHEVLKALGYKPGDKVEIPFGVLKANVFATGYEFYNKKGERLIMQSVPTVEEGIENIVWLSKIKRGDADTQHPVSSFFATPTKRDMGDSGRYYVLYGTVRNPKRSEFGSKEEADAFAANHKESIVRPIQEVVKRYGYKIAFRNPLTGDKFYVNDMEFETEGEAMQYLEENYDAVNEQTNELLAKERGEAKKEVSADDLLEVAMVHGKEGWKYAVNIKGKYANNMGMPLLLREFDTREDAKAFLNESKNEVFEVYKKQQAEQKKFVFFDTGENSRIGEDYRGGRDVTAQDFMDTFGFRGVQFGNWTNQEDRQMAVNQAFDAFLDLAKLLGVSPKALSLNGELGMAFGSRGSGFGNAHYEPGEIVINLTKTRGAGSLAHEWWHALDNYFARRANVPMGMVTDSRSIDMRPELRQTYNELLKMIEESDFYKRSKARGDYWGRMHEVTARLMAEWVDQSLKDRGELNTFLSRGVNEEKYKRMNYDTHRALALIKGNEAMSYEEFEKTPEALAGFPYPTREELKEFGDAMRNIFETVEEQETEEGDVVLYRSSEDIEAEYPNWLEGTTTDSGKHSTQVEGTRKTYKKVGDWIEENMGKDVAILDASSGMGYGTADLRERGFDIEDVEPYQSAERKQSNPATYSSYGDIEKQYDYIISNAVLNVIPDNWRADLLHEMVDKLKVGGKLFINTRKAGEERSIKDKIELDSPQEVLVKRNGKIASYQRFFTPQELKEWVESELGDGYTVEIANKANSGTNGLAAVVVTKNALTYDEAVQIVNDFTKTFKGAAKRVVISKGKDALEQQMREAGFIEESIEAAMEVYTSGNIPTAGHLWKSDGIVVFRFDSAEKLYEALWHENTHRALRKIYGNNRILAQTRFDELPEHIKQEYVDFLKAAGYKVNEYAEETLCYFVGSRPRLIGYLKDGRNDLTSFYRFVDKNYKRFIDFAQNLINYTVYHDEEIEHRERFAGFGEIAETTTEGGNGVHQRNSEDGGNAQGTETAETTGGLTEDQIDALQTITGLSRKEIVERYGKKDRTMLRKGAGPLTDREVVMESDPYSKVLGKPRYYGKRQREFVARQRRRMAEKARQVAEKLNLNNVEVLESTEGLTGKKATSKGWFDPRTGKITVVVPNHGSTGDIVETVLHEAVAHYGLRKLFGENFKNFLDNVYRNVTPEIRAEITELAKKHGWDFHTATEEYLASLAENTNFEKVNPSLWSNIKSFFMKMLAKVGITLDEPLGDNELRYILWRSHQNLVNPGWFNVFGQAEDIAKLYELGVGNYASGEVKTENGSLPSVAEATAPLGQGSSLAAEDEIRFREGQEEETARERYERRVKTGMYQAQEALQDSMLGLKEAMMSILGPDFDGYIEDVPEFENAYIAENALSSINKAEVDAMANSKFKPLYDAVAKLALNEEQKQELIDYMFAKHGLERNEVMALRDAVAHVENLKKDIKNLLNKKTLTDEQRANLERAIALIDAQLNGVVNSLPPAEAQKWYDGKKYSLDKQLQEGSITQQVYNRKLKELGIIYNEGFVGLNRRTDYAGLTALTKEADVVKAETEARKMVEEYEAAHDTADLWEKVRAVNDAILRKQFVCGLMSKETYDKISSMYQYYIPLRGFAEETSADAYAYLNDSKSGFSAPIKTARGRKSKADDPFANLEAMAESGIMQGNRNSLVKQRFLNFVMRHRSDLASVSELWLKYNEVKNEWEVALPDNIEDTDSPEDVERKVAEFEKRMEELAEANPELYKRGKDAENIPYRVVQDAQKQQHQVIVKRAGKPYVITINGNPRAAQAINGQTNPDNDLTGAIGAVFKVMERLNRFLSDAYTTKNPDFMVSNFWRDTLYSNIMTWIKESPVYAWKFNRNFLKVNPKKMKSLYKKYREGTLDMNNEIERMFKDFIINGGETGYSNLRDMEQRKKDVEKAIAKAAKGGEVTDVLVVAFEEMSKAVENCSRFAAFMTSRQLGRNMARSVYDAKEVSVNFNKKGAGAKFMGKEGQTFIGNSAAFISGTGRAFYVFWNAAIQGTTNFGRQFKRHPAKTVGTAFAMFVLGAIMAALGDDDEDDKNAYYNLPEYVRRSNILFRVGDSWVSIPLPVEFRALYGAGELMASVLGGKQHYTTGELAEQVMGIVSQVLPLDIAGDGGLKALIPSAARPLTDVFSNESWTGLPIYKDNDFNKEDPEWTKAYSGTNRYLVGLAEKLNEWTGGDKYKKGTININPARVEYLLEQYFGGYASTVDKLVKTTEMMFGEREYSPNFIPLWNRMVKAGDERTEFRAVTNEYYRLKDEYKATKGRLNGYENEADLGVLEYAEKLDFLNNSPEYARYEIFETYRRDIEDLEEEIKELKDEKADEKEIKGVEIELTLLRKEMIEEMKRTYK